MSTVSCGVSNRRLAISDWFDYDSSDYELYPRDTKVDDCKEALKTFFEAHPRDVFYQHQLELLFEKKFFHWITAKALTELREEGSLASDVRNLSETVQIRFYRRKSHRNWQTQAKEILKLVRQFSVESFSRALGHQGEQMFDAALPRIGLMPVAKNVKSYNDKTWTATGHDLDRIFQRNEVAFGVEIKNRLSYMDLEEIKVKLTMCQYLGLVPLFIVRMFPKSYFDYVFKNAGITLVFEYQLYPHGHHEFAKAVKDRLQLPVDCPSAIYDGTLVRLNKAIDHVLRLRPVP